MRQRIASSAQALAAVLSMLAAGAAQAQPYREPYGHRPGSFDYYTLVLAWSPTFCGSLAPDDYEPQCHAEGRRYGFVFHGLWPQYDRGYPEFCRTPERPFVPRAVINGMLDIMPNPRLVIHEYRKHGTCSGLSPEDYFKAARAFYSSLKIPERFRNPTAAQFVSPGEVVDAFTAANPQLRSDMIAVGCGGRDDRLREVRICFSKSGVPQSCGANEAQRKLCRSTRMHVPPVR